MFQFPGQGKPAQGILYDSDFGRTVDSVLALALLHGLENKKDARIASITISYGNLKAAQLCDVIEKFYASATTGPAAQFAAPFTLGLGTGNRPDSSSVTATLAKKDAQGKLAYTSRVRSINDTAEAGVLMRNMLMAQNDENAVIVLAGPATNLVALLDLNGAADLIKRKVKFLALAGGNFEGNQPCPNLSADIPAAKRLFAEWPTQIVAASDNIGNAILFPGSSIEKDFVYTLNHPIADAYRAYKAMPYDASTLDMAAVLYAARPKEGFFKISQPGSITITSNGGTVFKASSEGKHRFLTTDPAQSEKIVKLYTELASAKPMARASRKLVVDDNVDEKKGEKPITEEKKN